MEHDNNVLNNSNNHDDTTRCTTPAKSVAYNTMHYTGQKCRIQHDALHRTKVSHITRCTTPDNSVAYSETQVTIICKSHMIHTTSHWNYQPPLPLNDVNVNDVTQTGGTHCNTEVGIFARESRTQVLQVTCHYVTSYFDYQPGGRESGTTMECEPYISYMRSSTTGGLSHRSLGT
jgi:hypothetical protein